MKLSTSAVAATVAIIVASANAFSSSQSNNHGIDNRAPSPDSSPYFHANSEDADVNVEKRWGTGGQQGQEDHPTGMHQGPPLGDDLADKHTGPGGRQGQGDDGNYRLDEGHDSNHGPMSDTEASSLHRRGLNKDFKWWEKQSNGPLMGNLRVGNPNIRPLDYKDQTPAPYRRDRRRGVDDDDDDDSVDD